MTDNSAPPHKEQKQSGKGISRVINAFCWSMCGLRAACRNEAAFRQELLLCLVLFPLAIWLGNSGLERAVLIGCCFVVLIVELINSAIESAIDRIGPQQHSLSKNAKDFGSAAVFLSLCNLVIVWGLIILTRIFHE